jgi:hypothetical protein
MIISQVALRQLAEAQRASARRWITFVADMARSSTVPAQPYLPLQEDTLSIERPEQL